MTKKIINRVAARAGLRRLQIAGLAKEAKISYETAKRLWYEETDSIRFDTLAGLCEALGCQPGDLFTYEDSHD